MNIDYSKMKIENVSVNNIIPNRFQPRKNFDPELLNELAESIRQYGIIQPLVLRKLGDKFEIIAGERRYKAACMIGLMSVPAIVMELDDSSSAEIALIENVQRRDLTAIEEAKSYQQILGLGQIKQEELAKKIGKGQSTISNKLRLLNLSNEAQQAVLDNKISERHARSLLRLKDHDMQNDTLNKIIEKRMTVRETDKYIKDLIDNNSNLEQTEEILDFSDDDDNKKGDNMNENNSPVIDNFTANSGIPNIPDYDQININSSQQNGAYINEQVVNNAQVQEPSRFFNYDNQAANMNFDSSFSPTPTQFVQDQQMNTNNQVDMNNQNMEQNNDMQMPNIPAPEEAQEAESEQNNQDISNFTESSLPDENPQMQDNNMNDMQQQNMQAQNMGNMQPQQMQQNMPNNGMNNYGMQQGNNMEQQQMQQPVMNNMNQTVQQNPMNNQMDNNMMQNNPMNNYQQPNYDQNINQNNMMNNQQMYMQPQQNMQQNNADMNMYNQQQPQQMQEPQVNDNPSSQSMIMQQDITGAVAVIRNTIMNLQGNGYGIEINEQDLGNLYQIVINFKR